MDLQSHIDRSAPPPRPPGVAAQLDELEVTALADGFEFRQARENSMGQMLALGISTFLYMLFVVSIMPLMRLTTMGSVVWLVLGLLILGGVGLFTQARMRSTRVRIDAAGISVEQGSAMDMESISVLWPDVVSVELEPVDDKDGRKGMQIRILPRDGQPIDLLAGVNVGELTEVRRTMLEGLHRARLEHANA